MKREEKFWEDILKRMPSDHRWHGNSEAKGNNNKNWKRRHRQERNWELDSWCIHPTSVARLKFILKTVKQINFCV